ncbi:TIGR00730 family Rossman fold protein [Paenibacillus sp. y28]|uniref:LOG family protein n=1 Tax=Paenibacillus sp. y28 TaxID=3129110 RepID=UPI0030176B78
MKSVCVYAGSNPGTDPDYVVQAQKLGQLIAERGYRLIYGGSKVGLMGAIADSVITHGGKVVGVMPRGLFRGEIVHRSITQLIEVDSMHERKAKMSELADGFIALPGGLGTFEELFEMLCWSQIGIHRKPIALYNTRQYYDPLMQLITHSVQEGFSGSNHLQLLCCTSDPEELLSFMETYQPPAMENKWKQLEP